MRRAIFAVFLVGSFVGCAKPLALPEITVRASTPGELTTFRSELAARFNSEQLHPLDTALQELVLDAMHRDIATAAARELDMCAVVNGKTVHATLILGWTARRERILSETAVVTALLERDIKRRDNTVATGTPESITANIRSEQDILARLQRDLIATDQFLAQ